MAELRTEEEQIQAIKNWWKKNGSSLLIGIGAALAIVFGWQAWQKQQDQQRSAAAAEFANLLIAYSDQADESRAETVSYVASQLQEEFEDSAYAIYGTLILAQLQLVELNDDSAALASLQWAHERAAGNPALELVVRSRLARAQLANGQLDEALATVRDASNPSSFKALLAELEGDILMAQGDQEAAGEAYLQARQASRTGRNGVLELKLADLGIGEGS
ncbi:YfgM family protein [Marinobacter sp. SS21]|uniref:YfgM family protein n=1 Tax=Marinobacter sp. SS21 TaxID=2979460 RepID=UPI00232ADE9F|nr:tetratricopeptide repeat protein [Marinobacter sp. SS21]MDC0663305.1 tetratricopeptide repeat protein [Marinobacter sp. SS21]